MFKLSDLASITVGVTARANAPSDDTVRYVRVAAIEEGAIAEGWEQLGPEPSRAAEAALKPGDLLVRLRAGRIVAAVIGPAQIGAYPTLDAILVRPNKEVEPFFLCAVLNSEAAQAAIAAAWRGATLARVTVTDLAELPVPEVPRTRERMIGALAEAGYRERRLLMALGERRSLFHREVLRRAMNYDHPLPEPSDPESQLFAESFRALHPSERSNSSR